MNDQERACLVAQQQVARDMPYVEVGEAGLFQYHETSKRWYVEVDVYHHDPDQGAAIALYRVWRTADGSFKAFRIEIVAAEEVVG